MGALSDGSTLLVYQLHVLSLPSVEAVPNMAQIPPQIASERVYALHGSWWDFMFGC
ncbi:hypothetical protein IH601_05330 [Candidatus Bipolaricaulota bacterium]|nr:hypothetical protein [Candidatus Bipolaricaulota bacterium]